MIIFLILRALWAYYYAPFGTIYYSIVRPLTAWIVLGRWFPRLNRTVHAFVRRTLGRKPVIRVFVASDDPHSYVLLQAIPLVLDQFAELDIHVHVVERGLSSWSILKAMQIHWAVRDCGLFSALYNLRPPMATALPGCSGVTMLSVGYGSDRHPVDHSVLTALARVDAQMVTISTKASAHTDYAATCKALLACLEIVWGGTAVSKSRRTYGTLSNDEVTAHLKRNTSTLRTLGFYGPGIVEYEGEWYQCGRLHHLEHRLYMDHSIKRNNPQSSTTGRAFRPHFSKELEGQGNLYDHYGALQGVAKALYHPPHLQSPTQTSTITAVPSRETERSCRRQTRSQSTVAAAKPRPSRHSTSPAAADQAVTVEVYYSFRSPYSQLVLTRLQRLCNYCSANTMGRTHNITVAVKPVMPWYVVMYYALGK